MSYSKSATKQAVAQAYLDYIRKTVKAAIDSGALSFDDDDSQFFGKPLIADIDADDDYFTKTFGPKDPKDVMSTIPEFFPRLTWLDRDTIELALPQATPPAFVFELARKLGGRLTRVDDYRGTFPRSHLTDVVLLCTAQFGKVDEIKLDDIRKFKVEYIGQCRQHTPVNQNIYGLRNKMCPTCRGKGTYAGLYITCRSCGGSGVVTEKDELTSYASVWVDGKWSMRFPEEVLRKFFGDPPEQFDGDFMKLLAKETDLPRAYKRLAHQYHPDKNPRGKDLFIKLKSAYDDLSDPVRRKRYEAGLKFAARTEGAEQRPAFNPPKKCGAVIARVDYIDDDKAQRQARGYGMGMRGAAAIPKIQVVTEIISWEDIRDARGRVMTSQWDPQGTKDQPFKITWEEECPDFEINI